MSSRPTTPPPGWALDTLSTYLDEFRGNQWATFHNKRPEVRDLIAIDALFDRLLNGAKDPDPQMPMTFLLRAHAAYRAAVGLVMGGQLYEAQALLRLCLEHASYGFFIGGDTARWTRWMKRNDDEKSRKVVREEFTAGAIRRAIKKADAKIGGHFEFLYERLIDFGAHPNEQGFFHEHEAPEGTWRDAHPVDLSARRRRAAGLCAEEHGSDRDLRLADRVPDLSDSHAAPGNPAGSGWHHGAVLTAVQVLLTRGASNRKYRSGRSLSLLMPLGRSPRHAGGRQACEPRPVGQRHGAPMRPSRLPCCYLSFG